MLENILRINKLSMSFSRTVIFILKFVVDMYRSSNLNDANVAKT